MGHCEEAHEEGFIFALKHLTKSRGAEAGVQQGKEFLFFRRGIRKHWSVRALQVISNTHYNLCAY